MKRDPMGPRIKSSAVRRGGPWLIDDMGFGMNRNSDTRRRPSHRTVRSLAGAGLLLTTVLSTGAILSVASAVSQTSSVGADTPDFNITCTNVPSLGTVAFPAIISGSIPTSIPNGLSFSLSDYHWTVTIPATITAEINTDYGPNAVVSATYGATVGASGATPASQAETLDLPDVTVPASGPFNMVGTPTSAPSFTGTGASVSISPGPTLTGFEITVNGGSTPTFGCTTPTPAPVIAFAAGSNGPYAYVADPGPNTITPIDTATGAAETPLAFGDFEPNAIAVTPNGTTAYVVPTQSDETAEIAPINTATNTVGTPINTGDPVSALAISPDGSTIYAVSATDNAVVPISVATQTAGTPIPVGDDPSAVAFAPDGTMAYVTNYDGASVTPIDVATRTADSPIGVNFFPTAIAITPDGSTAFVVNSGDASVTAINLATQSISSPIFVGANPTAIAITPNGSSAYVVNNGDASVTPINTATDAVGANINVGSSPVAIAVTPDGSTAYVTGGTDDATPINTATNTAGTPIDAGGDPEGIAITPDQGPSAALTATTVGATTAFDASGSVPGTSPIVNYAWTFGDSSTVTTAVPTVSHTYGSNGTYTATVTETDAAGTSTTQVFTGQTVSRQGSPAAIASASVVIASTNCSGQTSCSVGLDAPAENQTPAQTIDITAGAPGQPSQQLSVTSGPGQLECTSKHFDVLGDITSYNATFTPTSDVTVTDLVAGATTVHGVRICFEGSNMMPTYLHKCAKTSPVVPCATKTVVPGGVEVTILVAPGDPRFRLQGIATLVESPTSVAAKGVIGKNLTIKGTELLGANGQTMPTVGFTSVSGSTIAAKVTGTATALVATVPNGAVTGPLYVAWPNETVVSDGSIKIT